MPTWTIEPRDPLIVRDGRPFGPTPGARAVSLAFPFPSTTTGGVRTRAGLGADGRFVETTETINRVKGIGVRGPLLVELDTADTAVCWLAPAPADALLLERENTDGTKTPMCKRLHPLKVEGQVQTNGPVRPQRPDGSPSGVLQLVGPQHYDPSKPLTGAPRFWYWKKLETWLLTPQDQAPVDPVELGHDGPQQEQRMHVGIQRDTQTALEGALFQTRGLEFTGKHRQRLALAVASDTPFEHFDQGLAPLGGERRLMHWQPLADGATDLFAGTCPEKIAAQILEQHACRLVLLTPAYFEQGFYPTTLLGDPVVESLHAVAVGRPQVVSGWDFEQQRPKHTRRLAPAGSVYFLKLRKDASREAIQQWIVSIWMQCVSDAPQDQLDGFGLAVLGTWSGEAMKMAVSRTTGVQE